MTPEQFIAKWKAADLKERAAAQSHFNDLCRLLDEPTPTDAGRQAVSQGCRSARSPRVARATIMEHPLGMGLAPVLIERYGRQRQKQNGADPT